MKIPCAYSRVPIAPSQSMGGRRKRSRKAEAMMLIVTARSAVAEWIERRFVIICRLILLLNRLYRMGASLKKSALLFVLLASASWVSCGGGGSSKPQQRLQTFLAK